MKLFRNENYGPYNTINPYEVLYGEIIEHQNENILLSILDLVSYMTIKELEDEKLKKVIKNIIDSQTFDYNEESEDIFNYIYEEFISPYILENKNAVCWLCETSDSVIKHYMNEEDCKNSDIVITIYNIPNDYLILSDLGDKGCLYAWEEK